jgi:hypothetical protein
LVQSATDTNAYFLCGQRTPKLLEQLAAHWTLEKKPQPEDQGPSCLIVHNAPSIDVTVDGIQIKQAGTASLRLAHLLPDLTGWKETLASLDRISTAHDQIEIWNGEHFVPCPTFYERDGRYVGDTGMYRLTRGEGTDAYQQVLYFDSPKQRWLKGDWYGLRFLAHDTASVDMEVTYGASTRSLHLLADERWPLLYERALVLASGMLPCRTENLRWFKYSEVSAELIHVLAQKLDVSIREV